MVAWGALSVRQVQERVLSPAGREKERPGRHPASEGDLVSYWEVLVGPAVSAGECGGLCW